MEGPVVVAIITSSAALITTALQSINQTRQNAKIERLKADLARRITLQGEYLKTFMSFQIEGRTQKIQGFGNLLAVSQSAKDTLRLIKDHPRSFPDRDLLGGELGSVRAKVVDAFASCQLALDDEAWPVAHSLKNACIDGIQCAIDQSHGDSGYKSTLEQCIGSITDLQQNLRRLARSTVESISDAIVEAIENDK